MLPNLRTVIKIVRMIKKTDFLVNNFQSVHAADNVQTYLNLCILPTYKCYVQLIFENFCTAISIFRVCTWFSTIVMLIGERFELNQDPIQRKEIRVPSKKLLQ